MRGDEASISINDIDEQFRKFAEQPIEGDRLIDGTICSESIQSIN